jgi:hypothetical protein
VAPLALVVSVKVELNVFQIHAEPTGEKLSAPLRRQCDKSRTTRLCSAFQIETKKFMHDEMIALPPFRRTHNFNDALTI